MPAPDSVATVHNIGTAGGRRKGPQYEPHSVNLVRIRGIIQGRACPHYKLSALGRHKSALRTEDDQPPFVEAVLDALTGVVIGLTRVLLDDADDTMISFLAEDEQDREYGYSLSVDPEAFQQ